MLLRTYNILGAATVLICLLFSSCTYKSRITGENIQLNSYYGSNMVFQKGKPLVITGTSSKNSVVGVRIEKVLKYAYADNNGNWKVEFPPVDYSGAFNIFIEGREETIALHNICTGQVWCLVGDGWLSDDYSNYEKTEASSVVNENVRYFQPEIGFAAQNRLSGAWKIQSRGNKKLNEIIANRMGEQLTGYYGEPVGIINLTWPGMRLEDLVTPAKPGQDTLWQNYFDAQKELEALSNNAFNAIQKNILDRWLDDSGWMTTSLPMRIYKRPYFKNRIIWWRKRIYIPAQYVNSDFTIDLGTIRGKFDFYFNGTGIGRFNGETKHFELTIADTLIEKWSNLLTVRMVAGDTLAGFYSGDVSIKNADLSFNTDISKGWKHRAYWEPSLPEVVRAKGIGLPVIEDMLNGLDVQNLSGLVLIGSSHFYNGCIRQDCYLALEKLKNEFKANQQYLFIQPRPGVVDAIVNPEYYNTIRNWQLSAASQLNYTVINSIDIHTGDYGILSKELSSYMLKALK